MNAFKTALLFGLIVCAMQARADEPMRSGDRDLSSTKVAQTSTCQHEDGYGSYYGTGATKHAARSMSTEQCVMSKVEAYERSHSGNTPDEDTVDMFMDACVNICR